MNTRKQYALFIKRISGLPDWKLCAITTSLAEQSWPNFALFAEIAEYEGGSEVRHCLNMLWDHVAGLQSSKNFDRLVERLDDNTPDPDNYTMYGVQPALDTIVGTHCALQCAMTASEEETASIMTLSLSTISKMVKYTEGDTLKGTELSQYIAKHPLYLAQQSFIDELLEMIKKEKKQNNATMKIISQFAQNEGVSQLGISLE